MEAHKGTVLYLPCLTHLFRNRDHITIMVYQIIFNVVNVTMIIATSSL